MVDTSVTTDDDDKTTMVDHTFLVDGFLPRTFQFCYLFAKDNCDASEMNNRAVAKRSAANAVVVRSVYRGTTAEVQTHFVICTKMCSLSTVWLCDRLSEQKDHDYVMLSGSSD